MINVRSLYAMTRALLPGILSPADQGQSASILNLVSMASSIKIFPRRFIYGTTKAAVIGMTKTIAAEKAFIARQPMGRLASVYDIAPQVLYLLSGEPRIATGQAILVDGGVTI